MQNCVISDCFPGFGPFPTITLPQLSDAHFALSRDRGHSGIWMSVRQSGIPGDPTTVDVTVSACTFERNHDGIETETKGVLPNVALTDTDIQLRTTNCLFQLNENGIEAVAGSGTNPCRVEVYGCTFLEHYNRPACIGGYQASTVPPPEPPNPPMAATSGAIVHRNKDAELWVRNSTFRNNSIAVSVGGAASTDLGASAADRGNNAFLVDSSFPIPIPGQPATPYQHDCDEPSHVAMLETRTASAPVLACGNRWIGSNQCTSLTPNNDGCPYDFVPVSCPGTGSTVPGPIAASPTGLGISANRNLALAVGSSVDFGLDPQTQQPVCPATCPALTPPCVSSAPSPSCAPFPDCLP